MGKGTEEFSDPLINVSVDDPAAEDVRALLTEHLADMYATSPAGSVHVLDHQALADPRVTLWTAREGENLLGCGAIKELTPKTGEIKSMRTTIAARGRGIATLLLGPVLLSVS